VTKVPIPFVTKTQKGGAEQDEAEARKNRDWDPNAPLAGKAGAPRPPVAAAGPAAPAPAAAPATPPPTAPVPVVVAPTAKPPRQAPVPAEANALPPSNDPLGDLARARSGAGSKGTTTASVAPSGSNSNNGAAPGADPFLYFVQAGAFRTTEDAEAQRAKLSLMGVEARVTEREQAGRTVYRVRAGPFSKKDDADRLKERLDGGGLESALVRVQR